MRGGPSEPVYRSSCATKLHERWRKWPSGIGIQVQIPNFLKLLWSKAMVVSVEEKAYKDTSGMDQEGER